MDRTEQLNRLSPEKRAAIASRLAGAKRNGSTEKVAPLASVRSNVPERYEPFPLSDIQQAYLIGRSDSVELGNTACHCYFEVEVADWNHERFEAALDKLIERHEMLRCIVLPEGRQQILPYVPPYRVESIDLRSQKRSTAGGLLEAVRAELAHQVRPTDRWPLFEFRVSHLAAGRSRLHVSIDMLIADARSIEIMFEELTKLYQDPETLLPPLELSFRDYQLAIGSLEDSSSYQSSREYWQKRVATLPAPPELPLVKNLTSITRPEFRRHQTRLDAKVWQRLKERSAQINLTPAGMLSAAYAEVLAIWSKSPHFTINLTLFNRMPLHDQVNHVIGDFTAVDLLEVDNSGSEAFQTRALRLQRQLWHDLDHSNFNGVRVMRELSRSQGVGPKALMPVVFTSLLNINDGNQGTVWAGRLGQPAYAISQTPQVYLDCIVHEDGDALIIDWDCVDELFPAGFLDDLLQGYRSLLDQLAFEDSSWQRTVANNTRALMPPAQIELLLEANNTSAPGADELLHTLFLKQVQLRPNETAVAGPGGTLTYSELYARAYRVEQALLDRSLQPNQLVAVAMEKGWEQVVAVLGIHFVGAAYLPIDPDLPAERQSYLIEHSEAQVVLTQSRVRNRLSVPTGVEVLAVDRMVPVVAGAPVPRTRQKPEDLAYVIYTSGSTGLPKGVMIDHRGATNTVLDINQRFAIGPRDRVLAVSRLSFDLSVYDIFGLLAAGGTIVMPSPDLALDPAHWADLVASEQVTVWDTVPALAQLLMDQAGRGEQIGQSLRLIMMSGDWIPIGLPSQIRQVLPNAEIVSLGGATEASIWSILYPIDQVDPHWRSIPYGRPMLNQTFHVLSPSLAPCPVWVPGQLYIGGMGLAKGYWRDEQKTQASFVEDPITSERLYRTGDLGCYLPDGNIEFLGREDFQVKLQGHRIELGEIEVRLQEHEGIEACVAVVREDTPREKRLVAYVVAKPGERLEPADLRDYLRAKLPEYMVPSAFMVIDRFPLTSNGKIDRKALPPPMRMAAEASCCPTVPRDTLELQLANLWAKVLRVHPVGLRDNFFDLGGHSLLAVQLFSELRKRTGHNFPLSILFETPTVEKLAEVLRRDGWAPRWSSLVPIQPSGSKPPFYCVHGAGGNVLLYHELARSLGSDYPFYGLQAQGLDGSTNYLRCVEDMAFHYLREIRELQPEGPYYLGGFCMGGHVAYEMAQRLRKDGEQIALLAMINTYNLNGVSPQLTFRERVLRITQQLAFHWANLAQLSRSQRAAYLTNKLKSEWDRELERLSVKVSNLLKLSPFGNERGASNAFVEHINDKAYFAYKPDIYAGRITLFKPERNYADLGDTQMGWGGLAAGGLEVVELPVRPGGILVEPYVRSLADELRTRIDAAPSSPATHTPSLAPKFSAARIRPLTAS